MAVVYEQQSWEGEIVEEMDVKQRTREAPQPIPRSMETVLGGWTPTYRAGVGAKLEGQKRRC